jgi:hypothetical protein
MGRKRDGDSLRHRIGRHTSTIARRQRWRCVPGIANVFPVPPASRGRSAILEVHLLSSPRAVAASNCTSRSAAPAVQTPPGLTRRWASHSSIRFRKEAMMSVSPKGHYCARSHSRRPSFTLPSSTIACATFHGAQHISTKTCTKTQPCGGFMCFERARRAPSVPLQSCEFLCGL